MRKFGGEWVKNWLTRLGMQEGEAIESRMVSRRIEGAQKKVEERNFEARKNLLEYDEVMDEQRKRVYGYRQRILEGASCKQLVLDMIRQQVDGRLDQFLARDYGTETFAKWAGKELSVEFDARDFRGLDFQDAQRFAMDQAERKAEGQIMDALEENLPTDAEDKSDWNWEALAKFANTRWHLAIRDRELKQVGRDQLDTFLLEKATAAIAKVDLSAGREFLEADYGVRAACAWVKNKFGIELPVESVRDLPLEEFKKLVYEKAEAAYHEKEVEYPVMAGLSHFTTRDAGGHKRYDREGLVEWARKRFDVDLDLEDLKNRQRDEIRALLIEHSRRFAEKTIDPQGEVESRLKQVFDGQTLSPKALHAALEDGRLKGLSDWLNQDLNYPLSPEAMTRMNPEILKNFMASAVEAKYRPEMQKLERALLLNLLDTAWKDHLLVMDHLRDSVGHARLRPGRSQGGIQARGHADVRADVGHGGRADDRSDLPHGAARRGFRRLHVDGGRGPARRAPAQRHRRRAAGGHRRHAGRRQAQADPQPGAAGRPQRSLPLRQREEVQELPHAERGAGRKMRSESECLRMTKDERRR